MADLLGRRASLSGPLVVRRADVESQLRRAGIWEGDLGQAVVALEGRIELRDDAARRSLAAWAVAFAPLRAAVESGGWPPTVRLALEEWVAELERSGRVRTLAGASAEVAATVLENLAAVVEALPAAGEPLPVFAAHVLGAAHALDDDQPVAGLAARAAEIIGGATPIEVGLPEAARRREAWRAAGVHRDELSSTVLVLNLAGDVGTSTGRILEEGRSEGQPVVLTLRQLADVGSVLVRPGRIVSICENPSVVAVAADRLAASAGPLICTAGQPGAATMSLLSGLRAAGTELRHHGDFDPGGVAIAGYLHTRLGVGGWRFGTDDYREAVATMNRERTGDRERTWPAETVLRTPWDPRLGAVMQTLGLRIEEEQVVEHLLTDLCDGT